MAIRLLGDGGHAKVVRELISFGYAYPLEGTIIAVGDNANRRKEAQANASDEFVTLIHPKAVVSPKTKIGEGTVIMAGAVVQTGAVIGKHVILNTSCSIDHDCVIEDYVHVAPGAHLCGNVHVGEGTLVGVGVAIAPNTKILSWSICKARRLEIEPLPGHEGL